MPSYPRLHVDEPEPPEPLPFPVEWAAPGRADDRHDGPHDAERALHRAQTALNDLARIVDELPATFPFRGPQDDDGPRAA